MEILLFGLLVFFVSNAAFLEKHFFKPKTSKACVTHKKDTLNPQVTVLISLLNIPAGS